MIFYFMFSRYVSTFSGNSIRDIVFCFSVVLSNSVAN